MSLLLHITRRQTYVAPCTSHRRFERGESQWQGGGGESKDFATEALSCLLQREEGLAATCACLRNTYASPPPVPPSGSGIFSPTFIDILRKSPEGRKDSGEGAEEGEHNAVSASTFEKRCLTDRGRMGIGSVGDCVEI